MAVRAVAPTPNRKHLEPHDPAGVFAIGGAVITPDGRSYAYTCTLGLTNLYLVEGIR
jgi:hypothetical protein